MSLVEGINDSNLKFVQYDRWHFGMVHSIHCCLYEDRDLFSNAVRQVQADREWLHSPQISSWIDLELDWWG